MTTIKDFVEALQNGNSEKMADLFAMDGVLHDSSPLKIGKASTHLDGRLAIEMMYHNRFGMLGGGFKVRSIRYKDDNRAWFFIFYGDTMVPVTAQIESRNEEGRITRLNVYPL